MGMGTVLNRRGGKYASVPTPDRPDYEISNFYQLAEILERDFDIRLDLASDLADKPGAGC